MLSYAITMATIDCAEMNNKLHSVCAVIFFVILLLATIDVTILLGKMRKVNPTFISKESYDLKVLCSYAYIIPIFFVILLAIGVKWALPVAEWIGTFEIIFYLKTFAIDFADYKFIVDERVGVRFITSKS